MLKKFIGDKKFYKRLLIITLPILVQNIITNFVSLIDNIMVGRVGTEEMTGVAIVNQLIFVYNLLIFGAFSGAGIFSAQFHGKGDTKGVRDTFRIKVILTVVLSAFAIIVFSVAGTDLIYLFLHEGEESIDINLTFENALAYLKVMLIGLPAFAFTQSYSDTLRSTDKTILPMNASLFAVGVNMCLNYTLIYGKFGAPELGVVGAALATVCARYVECAIIVIATHIKSTNNPFIIGAYRSFKIPLSLIKSVTFKGFPLMINELLWSLGMTTIAQAYSLRGIEVVSAQNISSTVTNLFNCAFLAFGSAIAIIIGQHLGAGQLEKAKDDDRKLIFACVVTCTFVGILLAFVAPLFPQIYNTEDAVKELATSFLIVSAIFMPVNAFSHAAYFTIRSGGKTLVTLIFDSAFMWGVSIPVAYVLSRLTDMPIVYLYLCIQCVEFVKCIIALLLLRSGIWINNLVDKNN